MSTNTTAAEIAASIDTATVDGHNLRALLLRLLCGEHWHDGQLRQACVDAACTAERLGFLPDNGEKLTLLGREVAELLRPKQWRVDIEGKNWAVFEGIAEPDAAEAARLARAGWPRPFVFAHGAAGGQSACDLVARLLTEHYLRAAKQYRTEPTP